MNFREEIQRADFVKAVCSAPFRKTEQFVKIDLRLCDKGVERIFRIEKFTKTQAFHESVSAGSIEKWLSDNVENRYKQICLYFESENVTYIFSKKNSRRTVSHADNKKSVDANNRAKKYILKEGEKIPAFVDLGIFTSDFRVVQAKQDKFRQINRFVELLDDVFKNYEKPSVTILDFGCGKSYLTFFVYYYFVEVRHIRARIIGYDLKADVVDRCNKIAGKYGYDGLRFVVADVSRDKLSDEPIDAVISLHACDTATDYALNYAVAHKVKYIFAVPCCQHEINLSIKRGKQAELTSECGAGCDLNILLKYGIVKERVCALLTDTIRAMLLEDQGYSVDVIEFVNFAHSPKNLMIRAEKTHGKTDKNKSSIEQLMKTYGFGQTLFELLSKS